MTTQANLYPEILSDCFERLPQPVKQAHKYGEQIRLEGSVKVTTGKRLFPRLICFIMQLPKAGKNIPLVVDIIKQNNHETWYRYFSGKLFKSKQVQKKNSLIEKVKFIHLCFAVKACHKNLRLELHQVYLFGIPANRLLGLVIKSTEFAINNNYAFYMAIHSRWFGLLIRYRGKLDVAEN